MTDPSMQPRIRLWDADMQEIPSVPTSEGLIGVEIDGTVFTIDAVIQESADVVGRAMQLISTAFDAITALILGTDVYEDTVLAALRMMPQSSVLAPLRQRPASCDPQPVIDKIDELVNESLEQGWFDAK